MADARVVSNYLVSLASSENNTLTPMQVLKLTYIAHGYSLGAFGIPLIDNEIEAWKFGPVIPDLYRAVKHWGSRPVGTLDVDNHPSLDDDQKSLISQIYQIYKHLDGVALSNLTHQSGTPWDKVFNPYARHIPISDDLIQHHYREILAA